MTSIDIAIPCYQYGRFLPDCVASVTSQGIDRLRVLIIDNASTDDSLAVARCLAAADPRIEILARPHNLGPHASFNAGIDWASADYFMVLCADDLLAPGALRRAVAALNDNRDAIFAYGNEVTWEYGRKKPDLLPCAQQDWCIQSNEQFLEERCRNPMRPICTGMVLVRTAAQKRAGHYRSTLLYYDDHEMLLRLADLGPVARTAAVQGIRRLHAANMSNQYNTSQLGDLQHRWNAFHSFFNREGAQRVDRARLECLANHGFAAQAGRWALRALGRGQLGTGAGLLRFMRETSPRRVRLPPLDYLLHEHASFGLGRPARALARLRMMAAGRAD